MIEQTFGIIAGFLRIYSFMLLARALLSWVPGLQFSSMARILYVLTEPYVSLFRHGRFSRLGPLDISFIWAMMFIQLLLIIVAQAQMGHSISIFMVLEIILILVAQIGQFVITLLLGLAVVRLIMYKSTSPRARQANIFLDSILDPIARWWKTIIAPKKYIAPNVLLIHIILILAVSWVVWVYVFRLLITILRLR